VFRFTIRVLIYIQSIIVLILLHVIIDENRIKLLWGKVKVKIQKKQLFCLIERMLQNDLVF